MEKLTLENMTNSEINIKMKELENEYEAIKVKIKQLVERMNSLDTEYAKAENELKKRKAL